MKQPIVCENCANALREVAEVRRELAEKCQQIDAMRALLKEAAELHAAELKNLQEMIRDLEGRPVIILSGKGSKQFEYDAIDLKPNKRTCESVVMVERIQKTLETAGKEGWENYQIERIGSPETGILVRLWFKREAPEVVAQ